jgi:hypothetical protein
VKLPLQTTYRDVEPSEVLDTVVREEAAKLEHLFGRIVSCRVLIERPHRHRRVFHVRIDLGVPGDELVVNNEPGLADDRAPTEREAAERAVRGAFRKAARRLHDYTRRKAGL